MNREALIAEIERASALKCSSNTATDNGESMGCKNINRAGAGYE